MPRRLQRLLFYRLVLITLFLIGGFYIEETGVVIPPEIPWYAFYLLIALLYTTTLLFFGSLYFGKIPEGGITRFLYFLIATDILIITGMIYLTGGGTSPFSPLYFLAVLEGGAILERRGGIMTASMSSISYGILINLEYYLIIPPLYPQYLYESLYLFYKLFLTILSLFLAGYLTGFLAEEVSKRSRLLSKTREEYSRLEAFSRNVLQSLQSGLITVDLKGRITFINAAGEQILGLKRASIRNLSLLDIFPEIESYLSGERAQRVEVNYTKDPFTKLQLGLSFYPLRDHRGELSGKVVIFQDLTKMKDMEESVKRSERLASVGQLAAGIAHEIRNPLASISGAIQLLREEEFSNPHAQRLMEIIVTESNRLNRLINEFLLYAQPPKATKKKVELDKVVEDTLEIFFRTPQWNYGIRLIKEIEKGIVVECDPQQMQQVLWNLLINAVEAMEGKGVLKVGLRKEPADNKVILRVTDTGKGIPPDKVERIFDPFFTTKERGTGLGLSIVHKIIEQHRGTITVLSKVGEGTTFNITMPLKAEKGGGSR